MTFSVGQIVRVKESGVHPCYSGGFLDSSTPYFIDHVGKYYTGTEEDDWHWVYELRKYGGRGGSYLSDLKEEDLELFTGIRDFPKKETMEDGQIFLFCEIPHRIVIKESHIIGTTIFAISLFDGRQECLPEGTLVYPQGDEEYEKFYEFNTEISMINAIIKEEKSRKKSLIENFKKLKT